MAIEVVGVDGCAGGWMAVATEDGRFREASFFDGFEKLLEHFAHAKCVAADIPIGLSERPPRRADIEAKRFLGTLASSIFFTPSAEVLEQPTYGAARATARHRGEQGVSVQAYRLREKIQEVERYAAFDPRIVEVHPEVSFRALKGAPLRSRKKTWNGLFERRRLLGEAGIRLPEPLEQAGSHGRPDDLLDAAVAAWTALRIARGEASCLPNPPEAGRGGRRLAIWY